MSEKGVAYIFTGAMWQCCCAQNATVLSLDEHLGNGTLGSTLALEA